MKRFALLCLVAVLLGGCGVVLVPAQAPVFVPGPAGIGKVCVWNPQWRMPDCRIVPGYGGVGLFGAPLLPPMPNYLVVPQAPYPPPAPPAQTPAVSNQPPRTPQIPPCCPTPQPPPCRWLNTKTHCP